MSRRKDPVTTAVRETVLARDGYRCVWPELAQMCGLVLDGCKTKFGHPMQGEFGYRADELQIDHVRDEPGGPRQSVERWLQALCPHHHLDGFATRKDARNAARVRLMKLYGEEPDQQEVWDG
jgi:hypothetical protein